MPNYPGSLDSLANPTSSTYTDDTGFYLDVVIATLNDIVEALEAKVGVGASTPASGQVLLSGGTGASQWGTLTTAYLPNRTRSVFVSASELQATVGSPTRGLLNGWAYWALGASADEWVSGAFQIPQDYASGNLTIKAVWAATSGETGNNFKVAVQCRGRANAEVVDTDTYPGSGASALSIAGPAASDTLYITTITTGVSVGLAAGNPCNLNFIRYGSTGTDTATNVFKLFGLIVEYTADM